MWFRIIRNTLRVYKPDVTEVKVLSHTGNDFTIRTRVVKSKFFISDVLDIDNQIHFVPLDSKRVYSRSASQRVVEIEQSRQAERARTAAWPRSRADVARSTAIGFSRRATAAYLSLANPSR